MEIKKRKNLLIIGIVTLVIVLLGSTYAFFMYSKTIKAFTLTSNSIKAEFQSGTNSVNMAYAYPISDGFAKQNLDKLGYLDFTVKGSVSDKKEAVTYEIYLTEDGNNTLDSSFIKVYLTDDNNGEVVTPSIYNGLPAPTLKSASDGKVILTKTETGAFESKYRIYVWIDSSYEQNEVNQTFSFKVNLYAYNDNAPNTLVTAIKSTLGQEKGVIGLVEEVEKTEEYNTITEYTTVKPVLEENNDIREYRYNGANVDNYITFNNEPWRIIGVFKEGSEEFVKIVRNEVLPENMLPSSYITNNTTYNLKSSKGDTSNSVYWNYPTELNGRNYNDWTTAGLQYYLNTENDGNGNNGYLSYLDETSKNMIRDTTYYLGNFGTDGKFITFAEGDDSYSDTAIEAFKHEKENVMCDSSLTSSSYDPWDYNISSCSIWNSNKETWNGKIGLLYGSDFGFSLSDNYWRDELYCDNYNSYYGDDWTTSGCSDRNKYMHDNGSKSTITLEKLQSSWLMNNHSDYEWFISPSSDSTKSITYWSAQGYIKGFSYELSEDYEQSNFDIDFSSDSQYMDYSMTVRPTLYLKSNVEVKSGTGAEKDPYILKMK